MIARIYDALCWLAILAFVALLVGVPLMFIADLIHIWGTIH